MKNAKGFTLIELLVVIAIIGMLSSIVLASLNTARTKAADATRAANTRSLKTALELYYSTNGTYPRVGNEGWGYYLTDLGSFLVPSAIGSIPSQLVADQDQYVWGSSGNGYGLYIYTSAGWCVTGVNVNVGWWGGPPLCNF